MLELLALALTPVVVGSAIALAPGVSRGLFRPVHTFAFAAAITVVLAELLPGAVLGAGPLALLLFAVALACPGALDRAARHAGGDDHDGAGLELAFAGLLVHQVVDGVQVGASGAIEHGETVVFAVAAHTFPLVAVAVLAYAHHDGRRVAVLRALALLGATALGVLGAGAATERLAPVEPWVSAAVAGVLLYMLGHDLPTRPPADSRGRAIELAATGAGMALPLAWLGASGHDHGPEPTALARAAIAVGLAVVLAVQVLWIFGVLPRRFPFGRDEHAH